MLETIIFATISVIFIKSASNFILFNNCCPKMNFDEEYNYDSDEEDEYNLNTFVKYHDSYDDILLLLESDIDVGMEI